jgi:hypothetical protein
MRKIAPHSKLADLLKQRDLLWRKITSIDKRAVKMRRSGKSSEADEANALMEEIANRAQEIEWKIVTVSVTSKEFRAKLKAVAAFGYDPDQLIEVAWILGHQAGQLGLSSRMPTLHQ